MRAIRTFFHKHTVVIAMLLAAAALPAGCAVEPTPGIGRSAPTCGLNAVLYCELAPHVDRCQCFRHSELRDMTRALSGR